MKMNKEIKKQLKSRINLSGVTFFFWFFMIIIIAKTPLSGDLIYWKVTWLIICVFSFGIWGYLWDKDSNEILENLKNENS